MTRLLVFACIVAGCGNVNDSTGDAVCGDGFAVAGEEDCDDGNTVGGDGCSAVCTQEQCGNATIDVGEDCDDGNMIDDDACANDCTEVVSGALLTANWTFRDVATNTVTGCPAGFDTAEVTSQPLDAAGNPAGTPIVDLFDCAALTGTTAAVPPAVYSVQVSITNGASQEYARSVESLVDLSTADASIDVTILNDGGYFALAWNLVSAASDTSLTCAQVAGLDSVEIVSTLSGSTTAVSDLFDCDAGGGITAGMLAGSYTISVAALNANNQALGAPQNQANKVIAAPNRVTDLGTITLPID
jgi:cysteine-rich repeat protein